MIKVASAFSGFSVKSSTEARKFYREVLGLTVTEHGYGSRIHLPGDVTVFFIPRGRLISLLATPC
jgi:catechol-2,3-dioxygenase